MERAAPPFSVAASVTILLGQTIADTTRENLASLADDLEFQSLSSPPETALAQPDDIHRRKLFRECSERTHRYLERRR